MWLITVPNICPHKTSFVAPKLEQKESKDSPSAVEIFLCHFPFTFQKYTTKEMPNQIFPSLSCCSLVCTMEPRFFFLNSFGKCVFVGKHFFRASTTKHCSNLSILCSRVLIWPNLTKTFLIVSWISAPLKHFAVKTLTSEVLLSSHHSRLICCGVKVSSLNH